MSQERPLLMIPGPVEVSPAVRAAYQVAPPSHLAPAVLEAFGASLERLRRVWLASAQAQPFVVAGGGTVAMDMAAANLLEPGDRVLVINTGYFSDRMAEMLRRQEAEVIEVGVGHGLGVGEAPEPEAVAEALDRAATEGSVKALFATHVDTSTGVRLDPEPMARMARDRGVFSVFDGVCATAAEVFRMEDWQADVYFTASQKALGLPAGLSLTVVSPRALEARRARSSTAPPMYLDWLQWLPIMEAYEARRPSYFSTPATNLVLALAVALEEILANGMEARFELHRRAARSLQAGWQALGLESLPRTPNLASNALSALYAPEGVADLPARIGAQGVVVAGGLHSQAGAPYFRVGHMGYAAGRPEMLTRTLAAVAQALEADPRAALAAARL